MEEKTFLYSVNPKKVIIGLSGVNSIRTAKSLYLTKEDVLICLQKASVYRRFKDRSEKVNIGNIDRLHRAEYISEEDWAKVQIEEKSEGHGKVVVEPVDEVVEQVKIEESEQETSAEVAELTSVSSEEEEVAVEEDTLVDDNSSITDIAGGTVESTDPISEEDSEPESEVQAETDTVEEESDDTLEELDEQDQNDQQDANQRNTVYTGKKKKNKNR